MGLRKTLVSATFLVALLLPVSALAFTTDSRLNKVAQIGHKQEVHVQCYKDMEADDPKIFGAWGYTKFMDDHTIYMTDEPCQGALAILNHSDKTPLWMQALGALVLDHESFHLRLDLGGNPGIWGSHPTGRWNEAATECRAIRHFMYYVHFLGGSDALAMQLQPYAWAIHWREVAVFPEYNLSGCNVPWWWK